MTTFLRASTFTTVGKGVFEGTLDESWYQGRGVFGGLLAAQFARCFTSLTEDPSRSLRSLTVHFPAPAPAGPARIEATIERSSSYTTHTTGRLFAGNELAAFATATLGTARPAVLTYEHAKLPLARPSDEAVQLRGVPGAPVFLQHLDLRFALGEVPFTSGTRAWLGGWTRLAEPSLLDAAMAACLLDSWPPGLFVLVDRPLRMASVDFRIDFFAALPLETARDEDLYLVEVRSEHASEGYAEERRTLWSSGGVRLAQCSQLFAVRA